jgi:CubicO group peptidase (beta-lactamase class C family)
VRVIGIDPGLTGAVALISNDIQCVQDTPTVQAKKAGGKYKTEYDEPRMASLLMTYGRAWRESTLVVIEAQQAMPAHISGRQGGASTFKTGYGYGLWRGIIAAIGLRCVAVRPTVWTKKMLPAKGKENARRQANELFPSLALSLVYKHDHGRADALLLAEYGKRYLTVERKVG